MWQVTSSQPVKTLTSSNVATDIFLVMGGPGISPGFFSTPPPPALPQPLLDTKKLIHQSPRENVFLVYYPQKISRIQKMSRYYSLIT